MNEPMPAGSSQTAAPALVRDLRVTLTESGRALIRGVSFEVREGETVGILGQSGSGKSLTSLALAGLLPRTMRASGSVRLGGQEVVGAGEAALNRLRGEKVAIVFQEPAAALDPLMPLGRQVGLALAKHAQRAEGHPLGGQALREAVYALFEEVKLPDIPRLYAALPHAVSGGQRQRVAIALALACQPSFLIADEPTSSMDAQIQRQIVDLIRETAQRRRLAVLFISHDIAVVKAVASRILVMKDGLIVEDAPTAGLADQPRHEYTRRLIEAAGKLTLEAVRPSPEGGAGGRR